MWLLALMLAASHRTPEWLGTEMPLPLSVRTSQDLQFKAVAEKQYLIFNLLAAGKVAYDQGDYASATQKWDALLAVQGLDPAIDAAVRPLNEEAHRKEGTVAAAPVAPVAPAPEKAPDPVTHKREVFTATVEGTISGGGTAGPGGAVITLKRLDGPMPRVTPAKKIVLQQNKQFVPHVLAVPQGTSVVFRNSDDINHNVFSLNPHFDTGLYGKDGEKEETFDKPGVVQLLCNIHSAMLGYVVVVDTPYFAQADGSGAFSIKGVAPGEYEISAWHENASRPTTQKLTVTKDGNKVALTVAGDKQPPQYPPDKYGKPRQQQLGY